MYRRYQTHLWQQSLDIDRLRTFGINKMSELNADVKFVRFFFKLGRVVGIIPLYTNKSSIKKKLISILYLSVLTLILCSVFILSVWDRQVIYKTMKLTNEVVDFLVILTNFVFILTIRIGNILHCRYFSDITETCEQIDCCLKNAGYRVCKRHIIILYLEFAGFHSLYFGIHLYEFYYRLMNHQDSFLIWMMYLPSFMKLYHQLYVINLVTKMNYIVNARWVVNIIYVLVIHFKMLN